MTNIVDSTRATVIIAGALLTGPFQGWGVRIG